MKNSVLLAFSLLLISQACAPRFYGNGTGITLGGASAITFDDPEDGFARISSLNKAATQLIGSCTTGSTVRIYDASSNALLGSGTCSAGEYSINIDFSAYADGTVNIKGIQISSSGDVSSAWTTMSLVKATAFCDNVANQGAGAFPSGTGTVGDPYTICTAAQLALLNPGNGAVCTNADYFVLKNDVDISGYANWTSLCQLFPGFAGNFDGDHYRVDNLTITTTGGTNRGFFGIAQVGSTLSNLRLRGVSLTESNNAYGGLVGQSDSAISRVSVRGTLTGGTRVGGLVGLMNSGSIANSWARVTVSGPTWVGGLVGAMGGDTITSSFSRGTITGTGGGNDAIGGLVGDMAGTSAITSSYSTADVSGELSAGGLVGVVYNTATITSSYSTGTVSDQAGVSLLGGLVGYSNAVAPTITNSYSTSTINSTSATASAIGGLIGQVNHSGAGNILLSKFQGAVSSTLSGWVGGICGYSSGAGSITITDSFSFGTAAGQGAVSGICTEVGGTLTINTSYSGMTLSGPGAINGVSSAAATVNNSYWNTDNYATSATGSGLTSAQFAAQVNFVGFTFDATHWVMGTSRPLLYWE